jgi:hypothetical protein
MRMSLQTSSEVGVSYIADEWSSANGILAEVGQACEERLANKIASSTQAEAGRAINLV